MKTNIKLKIENNLKNEIVRLKNAEYKTSYTCSKIKSLSLILNIITDNTTQIESLKTIEEKHLFFSFADDIHDELKSSIESRELNDYDIKNALEIINKLNREVK